MYNNGEKCALINCILIWILLSLWSVFHLLRQLILNQISQNILLSLPSFLIYSIPFLIVSTSSIFQISHHIYHVAHISQYQFTLLSEYANKDLYIDDTTSSKRNSERNSSKMDTHYHLNGVLNLRSPPQTLDYLWSNRWICFLLSFLLFTNTTNSATIISGSWNDDFVRDNDPQNGWLVQDDSNPQQIIDLVTNGTIERYHGPFSGNADTGSIQEFYLSRYFQCDTRSDIQISYTFSHCHTEGSDYVRSFFDGNQMISTSGTAFTRCLTDADLELASDFCGGQTIGSCPAGVYPDWSQADITPTLLGTVTKNQQFLISFTIGTNYNNDGLTISSLNITCIPNPSSSPTTDPTKDPTNEPTLEPTTEPTVEPTTRSPTTAPTQITKSPTMNPSNDPTSMPTESTKHPTLHPTSMCAMCMRYVHLDIYHSERCTKLVKPTVNFLHVS